MKPALDFIHRFLPGTSARTLLLLHGTGGTEEDLLPMGRTLDPEASLLSPRGKVLENGMPRFFRRFAEGRFDEHDLMLRAHELADFVGEAARRYEFDVRGVIAVGYSNGANIAGGLLLLRPEVLRAAALLRPMVPLVPKILPDLTGKPVFISSGIYDPIVPPPNARALVDLLKRAGAQVTEDSEDAGHGLTDETITDTKMWLLNLSD